MANNSKDPKVLRLSEIFHELNYRSYNAFAIDVGSSQPVVSNYIQGRRVPTVEFLLSVAKRFPQYNQEWLIDGTGEKYNRDYVDIRAEGHVIANNRNRGDNIINEKGGDEVKELYQDLINSLKSQIKTLEEHVAFVRSENDMLRKMFDESHGKE